MLSVNRATEIYLGKDCAHYCLFDDNYLYKLCGEGWINTW